MAPVESEVAAYVEHLNNLLKGDKDLADRLPLSAASFFDAVRDGVLLSKALNLIKPNTVNTARLTYGLHADQFANGVAPGSKAIFEATANQNAFLEGAQRLGLKIVNIGAQDMIDANPDLVLGVVWQLVRAHLLQHVDILSHPELIRLMERHENLRSLIDIGPETLLVRWFNYHLRRANATRKVASIGESVRDSELYLVLMQQIAPKLVDPAKVAAALATTDLEARARIVLEVAEALDCRRFVTVKDIVGGNARLNLAFTATLFNAHLGIRLPSEDEIAAMYDRFEKMAQQVVRAFPPAAPRPAGQALTTCMYGLGDGRSATWSRRWRPRRRRRGRKGRRT
jgi:plastin-1